MRRKITWPVVRDQYLTFTRNTNQGTSFFYTCKMGHFVSYFVEYFRERLFFASLRSIICFLNENSPSPKLENTEVAIENGNKDINFGMWNNGYLKFPYTFLEQIMICPCSLYRVRVMVFNATFHNISAILWQSVLLVEETEVPCENHWSVVSHWRPLSHNVASSIPHTAGFKLPTLVMVGTDLIVINQTTIWSQRPPWSLYTLKMY